MNTKNIIIGGVVGGIVDFLLGWLLYGMLFKSIYPDGESMNMMYIALGCLAFGLVMAYLYSEMANISSMNAGLKAGIPLGVLFGLWMGFFSQANLAEPNYTMLGTDILISVIITAFVGAAVGAVIGAMNKGE